MLLAEFWQHLRRLPDLLTRGEHLLAEHHTVELRHLVIRLMLALNGIQWPTGTTHLNSYLGDSQRIALQKTLHLPEVSVEGWIGRAVSLVVIYRWYAPQLIKQFGIAYPQALEDTVLRELQAALPDWPLTITTN